MIYKYISRSTEESLSFASLVSKYLSVGDVVILNGDLGAGKTVFAKGVGKGLNIKETIISPTFNIVRCYFDGRIPLYHIDAYRLEDSNFDIGLEEYIIGDGICLIEWATYIKSILPKSYLTVNITIIDDNSREYELISLDSHYDSIIEGVKNEI